MTRLALFALTLTLMFGSAAFADGPQSAQTALKAAEELTRYTETTTKKNERPDFSKPPASVAMTRVLDHKALAALPEPAGKDLPWVVQWVDAMNKVNQMLIFSGAKSSSEDDRRAAAERNVNDNQDAMFDAWAFITRMQTRMLVTADLFMETLTPAQRESRQKSFLQIRDGHVQFVEGVLTTLAAGVKPENAKVVAIALRETAPTWAPRINAGEQEQLRNALVDAQKTYKDAGVRNELAQLALMIDGVKPK